MRRTRDSRAPQEPDHRHRGLLRACRERPRGRAAQECDEVAPAHAKLPIVGQSLAKGSVVRHSKIGPQMTLWVQSLQIDRPTMRTQCPLYSAGSTDHCNTARSLSAGVSNPKVFRGRRLSRRAMLFRLAWEKCERSVPRG